MILNVDGISYRIGVEDVNSDESLTAVQAINTALQDAGITQTQLAAILAAIATQGEGVVTTSTHTWPVIANADTLALAANANRLYALFVNDGTEPIYLYIGAAAVMNRGIRLNAGGGSYEMSREIGNLDDAVIQAICASGGQTLLVTEAV